jgi:hypothetical protein
VIALCWFTKRNLSRLGGVIAMRVSDIFRAGLRKWCLVIKVSKSWRWRTFLGLLPHQLPGYTQGNLLLHHLFPISCNVVMGSLFGRVFGNYTKEQYSKHGGILSSQGH